MKRLRIALLGGEVAPPSALEADLRAHGNDVLALAPREAAWLEQRLARRGYEPGLTRLPAAYAALRRVEPDVTVAYTPADGLAAALWASRDGGCALLSLTVAPDRRWLVARRLRVEALMRAARSVRGVLVPSPEVAAALRWSLGLESFVIDPDSGPGHVGLFRTLLADGDAA